MMKILLQFLILLSVAGVAGPGDGADMAVVISTSIDSYGANGGPDPQQTQIAILRRMN